MIWWVVQLRRSHSRMDRRLILIESGFFRSSILRHFKFWLPWWFWHAHRLPRSYRQEEAWFCRWYSAGIFLRIFLQSRSQGTGSIFTCLTYWICFHCRDPTEWYWGSKYEWAEWLSCQDFWWVSTWQIIPLPILWWNISESFNNCATFCQSFAWANTLEHVFGDHRTRFKWFGMPNHLHLFNQGVTIWRECLLSFFMLNCYYCLVGTRGGYFQCTPPTLQEYLPLDKVLEPPPAVELGDTYDYWM